MIYDAIVIGVGGMGSAALYHIAKKGVKVLGVEKFDVSHAMGSSHGHTRVIRKAYFEHPSYVPMLEKAYQLWAELEEESGKKLTNYCGMIYAGKPDSGCIQGVQKSSKLYGIPIETLPHDEMRKEYPWLHLDDGMMGLYEADGGFVYVEDCVRAHCELAVKCGAKLLTNVDVKHWEHKDGVFHILTKKEIYKSKSLIVCAGAWTNQILKDLDLPLTIQRIPSGWFDVRDEQFKLENKFPIFGVDTGDGFYYGFPVIDERGIKIAQYEGRENVADVNNINRTCHEHDLDHVKQFIAKYLPSVSNQINHSSICIYTVTPDQHFIIDCHPQYENMLIAGGFSGHGFKFSPVVGAILSELVVDGKTDLDIDFFTLSRFETKK